MSTPWYLDPTINNWGSFPDPEGLFAKPDINILAPAGTQFTAPFAGTITGVDTTSSYGDVVTVAFANPPNSVATHYEFEHLTSIGNDYIGEPVSVGQILGIGGGGQSKSGADPGFGLTDQAVYGTGSVNEPFSSNGYINQLLNPTGLLDSLKSGTLPSGSGGGSTCDPNAPVTGFFCSTGNSVNSTISGIQSWLTQAGIVVFGAVIVLVALILVFK